MYTKVVMSHFYLAVSCFLGWTELKYVWNPSLECCYADRAETNYWAQVSGVWFPLLIMCRSVGQTSHSDCRAVMGTWWMKFMFEYLKMPASLYENMDMCDVFSHGRGDSSSGMCPTPWTVIASWIYSISIRLHTTYLYLYLLTLKVLNFWNFTWKWSGWISDSYCSLKPLWSGMGEVVPARTSPPLHPPSPPTVL